jgi:catechol 2,3-dioxygenase-like lactoylglutathione lyase family enzyme
MLALEKVTAFLATIDGARARLFYEGKLGLRVISDDDFALALAVDSGGTMLRVQKVGSLQPHPFTSLGWQVTDIEATATDLVARGVVFERFEGLEQDRQGIWTAPSGARVAWFRDPDGNVLSVSRT